MADWREGNDPKPTRKNSGAKRESAAPVKPQAASGESYSGSTPVSVPGQTSDWRGRKGQKGVGGSQQTRSEWMRSENAPVVVRGVRRKIFLLLASLAIPVLTIAFIRWVNRSTPKLPLLVASPGIHNAPEFGELPYSEKSEEQFRGANQSNIQLLDDPQESKRLLDNILSNNNWADKYSGTLNFRDKKLLGGGPDGNLVALFLSGFVIAEREGKNTSVKLLSTNTKPFDDSAANPAVNVEDALDHAIHAIHKSSKVWITLDVRPSSIVTNFGDLEIPLYEHVKKWFDGLSSDEQNRVILTLPCKDGQDNWVAPELHSSVLSHCYRMCLSGAYEDPSMIADNTISLDDAQSQIDAQVNNWTRSWRFASQNPQWIMSEKTKASAKSIDLVSFNNAELGRAVERPDSLDGAYKDINRLWDELRTFQEPYRWAPLEYGIAEAQLIHIEDLVEAGSSATTFNSVKSDVKEAIDRLKKIQRVTPNVSLLEKELNDDYYSVNQLSGRSVAELFAKEHALWMTNPPWSSIPSASSSGADKKDDSQKPDAAVPAGDAKKAEPTPTKPRVPSTEFLELTAKDGDVFCRFIIYTLRTRAASGAEDQWAATFNRKALRWCISNCQPSQNWLEFQFLKLLESEVNWPEQEEKNLVQARDRQQATALVWKAFCDLQVLSSNPRVELAWWLRDAIHKADLDLHAAVDNLVGEAYHDALDRIVPLQRNIQDLQSHSDTLSRAMDQRDRALWSTPHMLRWYLQLYRFTDQPKDIETQLARWGEIASRASELSQYLKPDLSPSPSGALGSQDMISISRGKLEEIADKYNQLAAEMNVAQSAFEAEIKAFSQPSINQPQTIRRARIAMRNPLFFGENRISFSQTLAKFYQEVKRDNSKESPESTNDSNDRLINSAVSSFLSGLPRSGNIYNHFYEMCHEDQRFNLLKKITTKSPTVSSPREFLNTLYDEANNLRNTALVFGAHRSCRPKDWHTQWPWSAHAQLIAISRARSSQLQVERLASGWWGDRDLAEVSSSSQLYFYEQANKYLTSTRADIESAPISCRALISELINWAQNTLDQSADHFSRLQLIFEDSKGVPVNERGFALKFALQTGTWTIRPSVYLNRDRNPPVASDPSHRTDLLDLTKDKHRFEMPIDYAQIDGKPLILALRGHYRKHPLKINATQKASDRPTTFQRDKVDPPTIRVTHWSENATKVIVMLDCSGSMLEVVDDPTSPGQGTTAFQQAKRVTDNILQAIGDIHQSNDIELGLVLFGAVTNEGVFPLERGPQMLYSEQLLPAEPTYVRSLSDIVNSLRPGNNVNLGQTPLYRAIDRAIKMAGTDGSLIYVVSDGFNDEDDEYWRKIPPVDVKQLDRRLGNNHQLHIYQFNNESFHRREVKRTEEALEQQRAEVRQLTRNRFVVADRFEELKEEIEKALPKSTVTIYSGDEKIAEGPFKRDIEIPLQKVKILPLKVRIDAQVGSFFKPKKREQEVSLVGDEKLNLEFNENTERLTFIPITNEDASFGTALAPQKVKMDKLNLDLDIRARMAFNQYAGDNSQSNLSMEVGLLHREPILNYTPRPLLVLARLAEAGQSEDADTLLADSHILPQRHFPVATFPSMPWHRDASDVPYQANFTVWMAFEKFDFGSPPIILMNGDDKREPQLGATLSRRDNTITVQLPRARVANQRAFVVCRQAAKSKRSYSVEGQLETHTFTLFGSEPASAEQPVEIELITVEQVNDAVRENNLTEIRFEKVSLSK